MKITNAEGGKGNMKNLLASLFLLLMLMVATPINGLANAYIINPDADALVNSTKPVKTYGFYYLSVYFDGTVYNRSYLKFDLTNIPDSAIITKAELSLYSFTSANSSIKPLVSVNHVSDDSWSEDTLTWNNRPAFDATALDTSMPGVNAWQTFNLLNGNNWNYALDLSDNYLSLIIKEGEPLSSIVKQAWQSPDEYNSIYPTNRPYLEIVYTTAAVPEPATMLLFSLGLLGLAGVRRNLKK